MYSLELEPHELAFIIGLLARHKIDWFAKNNTRNDIAQKCLDIVTKEDLKLSNSFGDVITPPKSPFINPNSWLYRINSDMGGRDVV